MLGERVQHLGSLTLGDLALQYAPSGARSKRCLSLSGEPRLAGHLRQEPVEVVGMLERPAGIPPLVEDAADEDRQLRGEVRGQIHWQMVSQAVQERPQHSIRLVAVLSPQLIGQIVDPNVGLLDAAIEDIKAVGAHLWFSNSRRLVLICGSRTRTLGIRHPRLDCPSLRGAPTRPSSTRLPWLQPDGDPRPIRWLTQSADRTFEELGLGLDEPGALLESLSRGL